MHESEQTPSVQLSRRRLMRKATQILGAVAVFCSAINRIAFAKASQKVAGYQDTPKGDLRCDNCLQWEPPSGCKVVEGTISPAGWCKVYVKKPAAK